MEATYVRESNNHYLVLPVEGLPEGDYQMPMLLQNRIPGLLPVHMQTIDGVSGLYYEVTSFRSLSSSFEAEKLDLDMILKLLLYMSHMAEEIARYLLRGSGIMLSPEYVFLSADREEICFCYNPCSDKTGAESLNCMARFILDHIDYDDRTCTALAYSLFQESMKESVSVADFARMALEYDAKAAKEEQLISQKEQPEYVLQIPVEDDDGENAELSVYPAVSSTGWKKQILEVLILGSFNAVLLAALFGGMGILRNYLLPGSIEMIAISIGGLLCVAILVVAAEQLLMKWYQKGACLCRNTLKPEQYDTNI